MTITWKQFKEFVDGELKKKNISEEVEVEYIDFSWVDDVEELRVGPDEVDGKKISIR